MNENIIEYLNHYVTILNPSFAVLIKGNWGSGKTWFIKKYIAEYNQSKAKENPEHSNPFLTISLYGVKEIREIDEKFFEQLHPYLSSTPAKLASKVLKGALNLGFSIPLGGKEISGSIPQFDFTKMLSNFENKIIVFDDFERSNLDLVSLLGYINNFVELQNQKVIILANDEKIEEKELFKNTNEKIIGKSFLLTPEVQGAIGSFLSELKPGPAQSLLVKNVVLLIEIFEKVGNSNLRNLRQSILHFKYFYESIQENYRKHETFIEGLLTPFFCLSLQHKNGMVDSSNWKEALSGYLKHKVDVAEFTTKMKKNDRKDGLDDIYDDLMIAETVPLLSIWPELIINGNYDSEKLNRDISKAKYFVQESLDPLTKLIRTWHEMSDLEFSKEIEITRAAFQSHQYSSPGDILHYLDLFLMFSKKGLISIGRKELEKEVATEIDVLHQSKKLESISMDSEDFLHFGGIEYSNKEEKEFKNTWNSLKKYSASIREAAIKSDLASSIEKFPDSFIDFCKNLLRFQQHGKYGDDPVLSFIEVDKFLDRYYLVEPKTRRNIIYAFKDRYELKYQNGSIQDIFDVEYKFLKDFQSGIKSKLKKDGVLLKPGNYLLNFIVVEMDKIIGAFDKKRANKTPHKNKNRAKRSPNKRQ